MNSQVIDDAIQQATGLPLNNFCSDLNAMAAAESVIIKAGPQTIRLYEDALQKHVANIVFASAEQRADAFLRTLSLWTE